ncbi:MAG: 50S ribosomal protein L35 [Dehalococcoidia bacterium]|nr:50S ribosomal protein L35 [Dehalococcoidia bacterium]
MPKLKTHKGAAKRFKFSGSGKLMRVKGCKSHFRRRKPGRVKGLFDETILVDPANVKRIKRTLPYGPK